MAQPINHEENERKAMADYEFRRSMEAKAGDDDYAAKRWLELDKQGTQIGHAIKQDERDLEDRPDRMTQAEREYQEARDERDDFLADNERPAFYKPREIKEYDKQKSAVEQSVEDARATHMKACEDMDPEQIQEIQDRLAVRQQEWADTMKERQGIAMLPSEQEAERNDQSQAAGQEASEAQGNGNQEEDGQSDQGGIQLSANAGRSRSTYAGYATTQDEHDELKQLEQDQLALQHQLGRRATHDEVVAFQEDRTKQEQDWTPNDQDSKTMGMRMRGPDLEHIASGEQRREQGQGM